MDLQRLKGIDIFRGLCMVWIILTHLIDWWLKSDFDWLHRITIMIFDPIGASGLLFISGLSITLSHRNKVNKIRTTENLTFRTVRNSFLIRALLIFIVALVYNSCIAIALKDPAWIWTWFVLLTAAISLFIAWPLFKTSKLFRISLGCVLWIVSPFIVSALSPYEGTLNLYGVLFFILYHGIYQVPLLVFFPFFLFGTVIGDILFDLFLLNRGEKIKRKYFGFHYLLPSLGIGAFLIVFGVLFKYPKFLLRESFSWVIYSLGINIVLISIIISFEVFELIKTKKSYKLLFYFSYYSLTIFLAHNVLHFLFLNQLNAYDIWFFTAVAFFIIFLILREIYNLWNGAVSLKIQIRKLSYGIVLKINEKESTKYIKVRNLDN